MAGSHTWQAWSAKKEAAFREYAAGKLEPMKGVTRLFDWIDANGIKKAAVTNAPRLGEFSFYVLFLLFALCFMFSCAAVIMHPGLLLDECHIYLSI